MKAVTTMSQGQGRRAALTILPLALLLTAMGGFAMRPQLNIEAAEALRRGKEVRVSECEAERRTLQDFVADEGYVRLADALDRARAFVASETTEIELHSVVRIASSAWGFDLVNMAIHDPEDPGFDLLDDMVVMHTIHLRGDGTLAALPRLVSALRAFGFPTSVLEFTAARTKTDSPRFRWLVVLGVFVSTDLPSASEEGRTLEQEGGPPPAGEYQ